MLRILVFGGFGFAALCGCGGAPNCNLPDIISIAPVSATADHMAKVPGNRQQFTATSAPNGTVTGCAVPAHIALLEPNWSVSDPVNVSVSSAKDNTNGLATCLGATKGAVFVTAGAVTGTAGAVATTPVATALLTCR